MDRLDIAVAGCGPAGLAAALLLGGDGHRVTLFERFEAPRLIGSGIMLQPTGLSVLRAMGLDGAVLAVGARVDRLVGRAHPSGRVVLDVRYRALGERAGFGLGLHRAALFDMLFAAVTSAGIPIETGRHIVSSDRGARPRLIFMDGAQAGPFDLIVDALGTGTALTPMTGRLLPYGALWATLDWPADGELKPDALEQRYERASKMAGVLPLGRPAGSARAQAAFFWSLRRDQLAGWRSDGLELWKDQVRGLWPATEPLLGQIDHPDHLTFAAYAHRTLSTPVEPGIAHIGDAWHSASPQLGQGANMALLDAWALAQALREAKDLPSGLGDYARMRRGHVRLYQALTALFTPVYQSDGVLLPLIRDAVVGPISKIWPATVVQVAMVSGLVGRPLKPLGLRT